jgi:hypothetical protein
MEASFDGMTASSSDMTPRRPAPCSLFLFWVNALQTGRCRARMFHVLYVDDTSGTFRQHEPWDMADKGVRAHFRDRTNSRGGAGRCG